MHVGEILFDCQIEVINMNKFASYTNSLSSLVLLKNDIIQLISQLKFKLNYIIFEQNKQR